MRFILVFILLVFASAPVFAQKSPPSASNRGSSGSQAVDQIGRILFDVAERKAIEAFYGHLPASEAKEVIQKSKKRGKKKKGKGKGKNKKMPAGLAKRKSLPPGLQKQLDRNGTLPPGLAKRDLPNGLTSMLPPSHDGTARQIVGNDVVLIHLATGVVLDILKNIVTK